MLANQNIPSSFIDSMLDENYRALEDKRIGILEDISKRQKSLDKVQERYARTVENRDAMLSELHTANQRVEEIAREGCRNRPIPEEFNNHHLEIHTLSYRRATLEGEIHVANIAIEDYSDRIREQSKIISVLKSKCHKIEAELDCIRK